MPDWFYRTVSQPVLFRLPAARARDLALGFMGRLARTPGGPAIIDFLGHMRADPRLRRACAATEFPTVVGFGPYLDARAVALPALARFGFGFLEVGPLTLAGYTAERSLENRPDRQTIVLPDPPESMSLEAIRPRVREASRLGLPLILRLGARPGASAAETTSECAQLIRELAAHGQFFSLHTLRHALSQQWSAAQWAAHLESLLEAARGAASPARTVLLCVPAAPAEDAPLESYLDAALAAGIGGLIIDGSVAADSEDGRLLLIGAPARAPALARVRSLRLRYGRDLFLIGAGGVHEPADALALLEAGADLLQVDSGLVFTGPGLPKRINDALLFAETRGAETRDTARPPEMTWFWTALMGGGMLFGSVLALVIAATRVVLQYDEAFVGMSRAELAALNPRLLAFMAHDRVSLAGTMISIGLMYVGLSWHGIRRGLHWARQAVFFSAFTGFASFFLFLGFGYLDTFHAFVTVALLQLMLLGLHSRLGPYTPTVAPLLQSGRAWRRSLWGQLLLIMHGFGLLAAGAVISAIGVTRVFVPEDLEFMGTTAELLGRANPRLVPLVAHDRATFGGMLLSAGWVFLLPALWGWRNGAAWLWWTSLAAGVAAYAAAIIVHGAVGYTSPMHLLPAFGGLGVFLLGLLLSYSHVCGAGGMSERPSAPPRE